MAPFGLSWVDLPTSYRRSTYLTASEDTELSFDVLQQALKVSSGCKYGPPRQTYTFRSVVVGRFLCFCRRPWANFKLYVQQRNSQPGIGWSLARCFAGFNRT